MKKIHIVLGRTEMSEEEINQLDVNSLFTFDRYEKAQIYVEDKLFAEGYLGTYKRPLIPYPNYFFLINSAEIASFPLLDWTRNVPDTYIGNSIMISNMV